MANLVVSSGRRFLRWFQTDSSSSIEGMATKTIPLFIALAAGTGLFLELAVIRWHSSSFALFGFYKNFSLLSCFLGLGIGYAVGKNKPVRLGYTVLFLCLQLAFFGGLKILGWHHYLVNPVGEMLTMGLDSAETWAAWFRVMAFLSTVFILNTLTFMPLGQFAGSCMNRMDNLAAYGANLMGSLVGIIGFTALCYLWLPPEVWFATCFAGLFLMMGNTLSRSTVVVVAAVFFAVFCVYEPRPLYKHVYSPYQSLSIRPIKDEARVVVSVNQLYYQKILDLSKERQALVPATKADAASYEMPFEVGATGGNVLVVGAGTGNDVAAALRRGASHVDAVEIDPVIQSVGANLHPEQPYQDPRVTVHINDARAFLRTTTASYDLIVYGLLDSHTMLSNLSNVRLDSFVYTVEAFKEARMRLKPNGLIAVSFSMISEGLGHKLFGMMKTAFDGQEPVVLQPGYDGGVLFLSGPGVQSMAERGLNPGKLRFQNIADKYATYSKPVDLSTDDWPFFYMPERKYPMSYAGIVAVLILLSVGLISTFVPAESKKYFSASGGAFFFLGAGFMLVETRAIAELGLTLGNTWFVIAAVIAGIMVMGWLGNWTVSRIKSVPLGAVFTGLTLTIGAGWWMQGQMASLQLTAWQAVLVAVAPLFFSGLMFSAVLKDTRSIGMAMSANLLGSICGGFLEYHSMVHGFRSLYLMGFGLYAAAFLCAMAARAPKSKSKGRGQSRAA